MSNKNTSLSAAIEAINKKNAAPQPGQIFIIGSKGMQPAKVTPTYAIGEVVRSRSGYAYVVVSADFDSNRMGQRAIRVNGESETYATPDLGYEETDILPYSEGRIAGLLAAYEAHRNAQYRKREEAVRIQKEETERGKVIFEAARPSWARAVIIAEAKQNDSDPMSDYHSASVTRTVVLAFSAIGKNDFSEMRRAAALFPETSELATAGKEVEHRENYTGGEGYYLGKSKYSGWNIRKCSFNDYMLPVYYRAAASPENFIAAAKPGSSAKPETAQEATGSDELKIIYNEEKAGIELHFGSRPSEETLAKIKAAGGWHWHKFRKFWYTKRNERSEAFAKSLL